MVNPALFVNRNLFGSIACMGTHGRKHEFIQKKGDRVNVSQQNDLDRANALRGCLVRLMGHELSLSSELEGREFASCSR